MYLHLRRSLAMTMRWIFCLLMCGMGMASVFAQAAASQAELDRIAAVLDSVHALDQNGRGELQEVRAQYGNQSAELEQLWKRINRQDSVNQVVVSGILDRYGWLSQDEIGDSASMALFLVVQHGDLSMQEKYLPLLRDAVEKGRAEADELAYLEDRIATDKGVEQIYGTQMGMVPATGEYFIRPIRDPEYVDERRASVGLKPLNWYVGIFGLTWNVEQYKKDLPRIKRLLKEMGE